MIEFATVVLIIAYIITAVLTICHRRTIEGCIGASAGFLCGGFVIVPIAEFIATAVCWIIAIAFVLFLFGCMAD